MEGAPISRPRRRRIDRAGSAGFFFAGMEDAQFASSRPKKQAVLLIHGIGEQRPMATLWKLVEVVWLKAPLIAGAPERRVYSEPDEISGVFELRRLSTNANAQGKRTDFFEFYWAHLMEGTHWSEVFSWLVRLALRPRAVLPPNLHKPWRLLHLIAAAGLLVALLSMSTGALAGAHGQIGALIAILAAGTMLAALLAIANHMFFTPVLGDAARYFRPSPRNVPCRQAIRQKGLELLEALHDSGKYDRIILVGHSLGGVIAYELALLMWGKRNRETARPGPLQDAIVNAETAARALCDAPDDPALFAAWREAQEGLGRALKRERQDGKPLWLISDLVTLGCPLGHAPTLMADTPEDFRQALRRREFAACPPQFEDFGEAGRRFSYCRRPADAESGIATPRALHNSAVFAAMRWSNIFFPVSGWVRGDFVGGPAAPVYGPGVADVPAQTPREGGAFPHMDYFKTEADLDRPPSDLPDHRDALRAALDLERAPAEAEA